MAVTLENNYTGNGSTTNYSITFEYIKEDDVKVSLDGTLTTAYSFANATTIEFTTAPGSDVAIRIYRDTDVDAQTSRFFAGSAIRAKDLNDNLNQSLFVVQEIKDRTWDNEVDTIHSDETWVSSDSQIATTAAMDARFQDETAETITSAETWPDNDDTIATTAAIDNRIDTAITNDIGTDGTGITVTDDGDGTITLGLADNTIDFSKLKDVDIITYAEQNAGSPSAADTNLFTASAAARRFDTLVQTATPSGTDWEVGKTWLQNDADKTLSVWDGDSWEGISSGGTFTSQSRVIYVDPVNGNDDNDGHRISRPKATIKDAIADINADDDFGDGSVVVVAPGVYQEVAPIQIQRRDVSIVGTSLRSCIVHPTQATETNTLFEVNSGTYLQNLTFTGVKASGTRGESGSLYPDSTYGLPATQGWNIAFLAGATIVKSPYIQNCTNFSDSEIDNTDLAFFAGTEDKGRAGDEDSAMTGGGILIDGSVPAATSPLRSMVCDSYTHVGLDGPGILVTNNGYLQATSSYAFFNHFHIACINGGQANLAASTTDFGEYSLIADGRSPNPVLTSTVDGAASDGATSFNIDAATGSTDLYNESGTENDNAWFGSSTRPASNMLVEVNSVTYPIESVTANGSGWTINILRPDTNNRSNNLGLNGAISDAATVNFYLRSMIASSGHTMEYVGSGTNYSALPENGGVPNEARQITELNDGKIWTVITDHNGKLRIGGNQTDDPIFEVDQQTGFITIPEGSIAFNLLSDETPQLGGNLDANGNDIILDTGAAATPSLTFDGDTNTGIYSPGADQVAISTGGTGRLFVDSSGNISIGTSGGQKFNVIGSGVSGGVEYAARFSNGAAAAADNAVAVLLGDASDHRVEIRATTVDSNNGYFSLYTLGGGTRSEKLRITSDGKVGIGTSSPATKLNLVSGTFRIDDGTTALDSFVSAGEAYTGAVTNHKLNFVTNNTVRATLDTSGRLGIGTTSPSFVLDVQAASATASIKSTTGTNLAYLNFNNTAGNSYVGLESSGGGNFSTGTAAYALCLAHQGAYPICFATNNTERVRIESDGKTKFSGSVYGNETTITASDFDLNDGNFFTCGAIAIPNPTNGVAGMSGLIRVTAAPTSFGSNWDFPGGSYTAPTAFPAVAPFYVVSSTQFYLGNWTEGIA